jgi:CDP-paratose 2-epimerase
MDDRLGIVEWFHPRLPQEKERAAWLVPRLRDAGFRHVRFNLSWAELVCEEWEGTQESFYDFLFPLLTAHFESVLPDFAYTPPSWGRSFSDASPPREAWMAPWWVEQVCRRWGEHFDALEFWNEANSPSYWDVTHDPGFEYFAAQAKQVADVLHASGKQAVLGGPSPIDLAWFRTMSDHRVLSAYDAVGIHGFPGTWDGLERPGHPWRGWNAHLDEVQRLLDDTGSAAEIWITEVGASSLVDPTLPTSVFRDVLASGAPRIYWYAAMDHAGRTVQERNEGKVSEHDYHMGLFSRERKPKPLYRDLVARHAPERD